ncbi:CRTAC1 family protein [Chloroflexi bacterium TSY]|nr:CRTAC1 family protein [Chloroflexi bacterium TSY]
MSPPYILYLPLSFLISFSLFGCQPLLVTIPTPVSAGVPVTVSVHELAVRTLSCSGRFVPHLLDHTTTTPGGDTVRMFEANGGGVAINDLDGDGWLDIVLANHRDPNTILWNEGRNREQSAELSSQRFKTDRLADGDARGVTIVDVDGDGKLDIVFSRRASAPNYWRNLGERRFVQEILPGVSKPLYAINWGDLDGDGDLDLVGGTYDAGLLADFGQEFLNSTAAGVYLYTQENGRFVATPLALNAQALALALVDLNGDQRLDILVGNDFAVPDYAWLNMSTGSDRANKSGWQSFQMPVMSHSTMSLAIGDVDNDGQFEIFSTDMKPYTDDPAVNAAWAPVMASMMDDPHPTGDPQVMANVLQYQVEGAYRDEAAIRGVDASGWSWSGKFGDLDQDGFLDLYIVNSMIEATTFAHLPNHELVEENQVLRNQGNGSYTLVPEWGLGSTASGRGMSMGDLDGDGDLDIVVNNLRSPTQLFENQLCTGSSLKVDLHWPHSGNSRALGARLALYTSAGIYWRQVDAASGYLSGEPAQIHFGVPNGVRLEKLEVFWPDGGCSRIEGLEPDRRVEVVRDSSYLVKLCMKP